MGREKETALQDAKDEKKIIILNYINVNKLSAKNGLHSLFQKCSRSTMTHCLGRGWLLQVRKWFPPGRVVRSLSSFNVYTAHFRTHLYKTINDSIFLKYLTNWGCHSLYEGFHQRNISSVIVNTYSLLYLCKEIISCCGSSI